VALRQQPLIVVELHRWWFTALRSRFQKARCNESDESDTGRSLSQRDYVALLLRVSKVVFKDHTLAAAHQIAESDWAADSRGGDEMSRDKFLDAIFELADLWAVTTDAQEYVSFLRYLFAYIAEARHAVAERFSNEPLNEDGSLHYWRAYRDIRYARLDEAYRLHAWKPIPNGAGGHLVAHWVLEPTPHRRRATSPLPVAAAEGNGTKLAAGRSQSLRSLSIKPRPSSAAPGAGARPSRRPASASADRGGRSQPLLTALPARPGSASVAISTGFVRHRRFSSRCRSWEHLGGDHGDPNEPPQNNVLYRPPAYANMSILPRDMPHAPLSRPFPQRALVEHLKQTMKIIEDSSKQAELRPPQPAV